MSNSGYVYCFSNQYIPTLLKIGLTTRKLRERLREANRETYSPPYWKCEVAKYVENVESVETNIHKLLEAFKCRLTPKREFFTLSVEQARLLFTLLPGEYYNESQDVSNVEELNATESDTESEEEPIQEQPTQENQIVVQTPQNREKNLSEYFIDGTQIKHALSDNNTWYGMYNASKNCIVDGKNNAEYPSLTYFARVHFADTYPERIHESRKRSGWSECQALINGEWQSTRNLKPLNSTNNTTDSSS